MARVKVLILFFAVFIGSVTSVMAEIVIIVNETNPTAELSSRQIVGLYMGRYQNFPDGSPAFTLDLLPESEVRQQFYRQLINKSVAEVNAYWARLLFTGRATPPRVLDDSETVLKVVQENSGAIGYIDSVDLSDGVKVVGRVD